MKVLIIGGVITDPEDLTLQTPESFFARFRINMKVHHEVIAIDPDRKTVRVKNLKSGEEFEEAYDKLILSPGAKPTQPKLPGVGIKKVFTLRTVEDTFRMKEYIAKNQPKSAVLAGGGFIGLELAENIADGILKQWYLKDIESLPMDGSVTLLDVRTAGEYSRGHLDGFKNIPVDELRGHLDEIEKDKPVYVICQSGLRSYIATRILEGRGIRLIISLVDSGIMRQ